PRVPPQRACTATGREPCPRTNPWRRTSRHGSAPTRSWAGAARALWGSSAVDSTNTDSAWRSKPCTENLLASAATVMPSPARSTCRPGHGVSTARLEKEHHDHVWYVIAQDWNIMCEETMGVTEVRREGHGGRPDVRRRHHCAEVFRRPGACVNRPHRTRSVRGAACTSTAARKWNLWGSFRTPIPSNTRSALSTPSVSSRWSRVIGVFRPERTRLVENP